MATSAPAPTMSVIDIETLNSQGYEDQNTDPINDPFAGATTVTANMLKKRPDICKALMEPLKDMIIPWEDEELEEPDDFMEQQVANAVNLDPFIQTTVFECLNGLGDVTEHEGDEMYFPSILEERFNTVKEITKQHSLGGFREDHDSVPAKYAHLSPKYQDMIYTHPDARKILSTLPTEAITEDFVDQLCQDE